MYTFITAINLDLYFLSFLMKSILVFHLNYYKKYEY
jgi:hypothetical protein